MSSAIVSRRPGLLLVLLIALPAFALGKLWPLLGGAVLGIVLGIGLRHFVGIRPVHLPGVAFAGKQLLQVAIILLGFGLSLGQVAQTGRETFAVTLVSIVAALATAAVLGWLLRIHGKLQILVGVGTAICGGSAIAAVTPIIKPEQHDTAFAISTIFLFNLVAVLTFPALGHALGLSELGFGLWAGTAINDTSSVVAAAYAYSPAAGDYATVVKLTRATLIIPICLLLALAVAWMQRQHGDFSLRRIFPWFILGFLATSALRSAELVPVAVLPMLQLAAQFLIVMALTAIGLSADLRKMAATGARPILLGLGTWIAVAVSSLVAQKLIGQW
ncbi:MAG TPA: putative sulfate exporter family transporter [Arenimonas sp.]|nr:putative sulfate exporter family transporter [Arenimonas sp.]